MNRFRLWFNKALITLCLYFLFNTEMGRLKLYSYLQRKLVELCMIVDELRNDKELSMSDQLYYCRRWRTLASLKTRLNRTTPDDVLFLRRCTYVILFLLAKHPSFARHRYFSAKEINVT